MFGIFQPVLGAIVILGIGFAFSTNRRAMRKCSMIGEYGDRWRRGKTAKENGSS